MRTLKYGLLGLLVSSLCLLLLAVPEKGPKAAFDADACAGPPFQTVLAREEAMQAGYLINTRHDCIDKASYLAIQRQTEEQKTREAASARSRPPSPAVQPEPPLAQARRGFVTRVAVPTTAPPELPRPPAELFVRADYPSATEGVLPAFVTPDPKDGRRHPAIVWLTGGDSSSLGDFWTPGPPGNDQSAHAFREAGMVMMFPTLRGGHVPGHRQYFLGEVDDVLAAAEHLARLPYVDPTRIYLGGHSTGGTLALLTAETSPRFQAVFAFGPVTSVDRYPPALVPIRFDQHAALELKLRSPIHWLKDIATPTYLIEGSKLSSNIADLDTLCQDKRNPLLHCIAVEDEDHFSVIARVSRVVAARLVAPIPGTVFSLRPEEFRKTRSGP